MKWLAFVLVLVCVGRALAQTPKTLRIAAAADLQPVMPAFAFAYERSLESSWTSASARQARSRRRSGMARRLTCSWARITCFPEQVIAAGLAVEKLPVPYAQGDAGAVVAQGLAAGATKRGAADRPTRDADRGRRPFPCPVRASRLGLPAQHAKLEEKVKGKLVTAENISQTAQFVESGNAQIGFVSLDVCGFRSRQREWATLRDLRTCTRRSCNAV